MNATTSQTTINISTTQAKPQSSIKLSFVYDYKGNRRTIEKVKGIQI